MSQQVLIQDTKKIPEEIINHLRKELELYTKEDSFKLAKAQERKVFRSLLKQKNLTKDYMQIKKKLTEIRKNNNLIENDSIRSQYYRLLTQKMRIEVEIKSEKEFIETNNVTKEKAKEYRKAYKDLRLDFELNIKPKIPL